MDRARTMVYDAGVCAPFSPCAWRSWSWAPRPRDCSWNRRCAPRWTVWRMRLRGSLPGRPLLPAAAVPPVPCMRAVAGRHRRARWRRPRRPLGWSPHLDPPSCAPPPAEPRAPESFPELRIQEPSLSSPHRSTIRAHPGLLRARLKRLIPGIPYPPILLLAPSASRFPA